MVIKKLRDFAVVFVATSAIVSLHPSPIRAQGQSYNIREDISQSIWNDVIVDPNSPLSFSGEGAVIASGQGNAKLYIEKGDVKTGGKGVVGVKTTGDSVKTIGWEGHEKVGDWVFYWGEGGISVEGDNYNMISYLLPGQVSATGNLGGSFEGDWRLKMRGFSRSAFEQILRFLVPDFIKQKLISSK